MGPKDLADAKKLAAAKRSHLRRPARVGQILRCAQNDDCPDGGKSDRVILRACESLVSVAHFGGAAGEQVILW